MKLTQADRSVSDKNNTVYYTIIMCNVYLFPNSGGNKPFTKK